MKVGLASYSIILYLHGRLIISRVSFSRETGEDYFIGFNSQPVNVATE